MKPLCILEMPSNLGLKQSAIARQPGVRRLPDWLRSHGLHEALHPVEVKRLEPPPYSMNLDEVSGVRNANAIVAYAGEQADMLVDVLSNDQFPIVLGGDCSILIGNALALKRMGNYGLFFLDGHTDFIWPPMSETGGAAGMDLAIVTGNAHDKLTNIDGQKPYMREEHVWCVGNREYTDWYVKAATDSNLHYVDLRSLRNAGINECVNNFVKMVEAEKLDGFWLHVDVDVLNDEIMPAVDSRQPDGLDYAEFHALLIPLLRDDRAMGIDITILDPDLDPEGTYTKPFVRQLASLFNPEG